MTMARAQLVNTSVTRWYHCINRCVRRAFLLGEAEGEGVPVAKIGSKLRLQELAKIFAVSVGGFSVMDNHLHVLVRLDPDMAKDWSDEEVVRRWGRLFPPRGKDRQPMPVSNEWVQWRLQDTKWVATARERLQSLSWFMKCLKEPLARMANQQDKVRGAFFEERFKSIGILDEESLLATCAYIDLNPVAAGIVEAPEASPHTSISARRRTRQSPGPNRRPPDRGARRPRNAQCIRRPRRITLALPDRRSKPARFHAQRNARRILTRKLSASWSTTPAASSEKAKR